MIRKNPARVLAEALIRNYFNALNKKQCLEIFNKEFPITPESDTSEEELIESLQLDNNSLILKYDTILEKLCHISCLPELIENYETSIIGSSPKPSANTSSTNLQQKNVIETEIKSPPISQEIPTVTNTINTIPIPPSIPIVPNTIPTPSTIPIVSNTLPTPKTNEVIYTAKDGKTFTDRSEFRKYQYNTFYKYSNKNGETLRKNPGDIDGQQFGLDNINNCTIELLDHISTINCDDITNSVLCIGPVSDSIFFRNCSNSTIYVAAKQIRTRDCSNLKIYSYSMTDPSIETSHHIMFGPHLLSYPKLNEQTQKAGFDVNNNHWKIIFDFNKNDSNVPKPHYTIMSSSEYEPKIIKLEGEGEPENPYGLVAKEVKDTTMKSFSIETSMEEAERQLENNE